MGETHHHLHAGRRLCRLCGPAGRGQGAGDRGHPGDLRGQRGHARHRRRFRARRLPGHLPGSLLAHRAGHRHHRPLAGRMEARLRALQRLRRGRRRQGHRRHHRPHPPADAGCNGKVGAVGFCLGGLLAFLTASRTDADACVAYYGVGIERYAAEAEKLAEPLLMHIAEEDQFVPKEAQAVILAALKRPQNVSDPHLSGTRSRLRATRRRALPRRRRRPRGQPHPGLLPRQPLMRAVRARAAGGPEVLEVVDLHADARARVRSWSATRRSA